MISNLAWWTSRLDLLRYLVVLRVNAPVVRFRWPPSADIAYTLAFHIAERLPVSQVKPWRSMLNSWEFLDFRFSPKTPIKFLENAWPIPASIVFYPEKKFFGKGEPILFEIKLMGKEADHGFFLETILPILETLSQHSSGWKTSRFTPWGNFDIQSVFVARGHQWVPLVENGRLDLRRRFTTENWRRDLSLHHRLGMPLNILHWMTPVYLPLLPHPANGDRPPSKMPELRDILEAFLSRAARLILGRWGSAQALIEAMDPEVRQQWMESLDAADRIRVVQHEMVPLKRYKKGLWKGCQVFSENVPESIVPYLHLAALFHVGQYSHFGSGTFFMN